jgi:4-amino-4-deoxy-L-arabinose transferase-like glycosyltransferase
MSDKLTKEITIEIKRPEIIILLAFLLLVLILELQITFPSPIAFGDEGFHTRLAQWIAKEKEYPVWYPFVGTKLVRNSFFRPPLWNILEGSFYFLLGFNDVIVKFLTPFIGTILIGIAIFLFGAKNYSKKVGFIAAIIAVTIPSVVTYSVLFYTDILFTFYFCLFILTFINAIKTENKKYWILTGIFSALAILTDNTGIIIVPSSIILFFLYQVYKEGFSKKIKSYFVLILLLVLISGPYFLRNFVYYGTPNCNLPLFRTEGCQKTFEYKNNKEFKGGVVGGGSSESILRIGIMNYFNFAYGNILFIPLAFLCGLFYIGVRKRNVDVLLFLTILTFLSIFYVSMTGRSEDLARNTLSFSPAVAFISGIYFSRIRRYVSKNNFIWVGVLIFLTVNFFIIFYYYIKISLILSITLGVILFIATIYFLLVKNYQYALMVTFFSFIILFSFVNFYDKITGMVQVKQFSPSFFEACKFIKQNTTDDSLILTVWDYATTYNSQRNVWQLVGMPDSGDILLSGDVNLTLSRLKAHGATHIFVQKFSINPVYYPPEFVNFIENNPKNFVKIYENGPPLQQCLQAGNCDGNILYEINYTKMP